MKHAFVENRPTLVYTYTYIFLENILKIGRKELSSSDFDNDGHGLWNINFVDVSIHIRHTDIATRNFYSTLFCSAGLIVSEFRLWDRTRDRTNSRYPTDH